LTKRDKEEQMSISTINPSTGVVEKTFDAYSPDEIEQRIARAQAAVDRLRLTTFEQRADWMRATADLLESELDTVAPMLTAEMGKTLVSARAEVKKCVKNMLFYADNAARFLADEPLEDPTAVGASRAFARYEPLGVVLAVMPWNYPLWQVIRFAAPALMAGNAGLLKHASNVPRAALYLDTLFARGGFPEGSFSALLIGSYEVESVLADRRVKAITLTGSEGAGRAVAGTAGRHIKKAVLELGGSDPFIVMPSADVAEAARVAAIARTSNNGQSCIAAKRFLVHHAVYERFVPAFVAAMAAMKVGDPMDETTDIGPIATESGRTDLVELVEDAVAKGAWSLTGGTVPDGPGWFYPPTVLAGITPEMRLYAEEVFGPVATLLEVQDIDEALAVANTTTFGLSSSVWTTDDAEQCRFTAELDAGAVFINGMTVSYPELPFGGVKDSGYGRELSAAGIREFCNLKTVWQA
jgi:succinate-semialdehyde dehydrogenase/glutarate-semialdehyde dehydrogenase